jgi:hypothetical protein
MLLSHPAVTPAVGASSCTPSLRLTPCPPPTHAPGSCFPPSCTCSTLSCTAHAAGYRRKTVCVLLVPSLSGDTGIYSQLRAGPSNASRVTSQSSVHASELSISRNTAFNLLISSCSSSFCNSSTPQAAKAVSSGHQMQLHAGVELLNRTPQHAHMAPVAAAAGNRVLHLVQHGRHTSE